MVEESWAERKTTYPAEAEKCYPVHANGHGRVFASICTWQRVLECCKKETIKCNVNVQTHWSVLEGCAQGRGCERERPVSTNACLLTVASHNTTPTPAAVDTRGARFVT